jgi:hypothetical protein
MCGAKLRSPSWLARVFDSETQKINRNLHLTAKFQQRAEDNIQEHTFWQEDKSAE